ncbi:helix-turn-helix domain containing protein [Blastococcus montanus]|uniref:helix-turn-helix domain containing protein n=1 Tax=Blastococcus montanus TaxID=3144973 RepID=UPI003208C345
MPYPPRPQLRPLPEFAGTASPRPDQAVQARVEGFTSSSTQPGEACANSPNWPTGLFSAVRNILDKHGVRRRDAGAAALRLEPAS